MESSEPDMIRALERGLGEYVRAVAAAVGVPAESAMVEVSDTATAYLGLPRSWLGPTDRDVMLVWSERRGWSIAVETRPAEVPMVIAHLGGDDLVPSPRKVAQFVADSAAGRHVGQERPAFVTVDARGALAERLSYYVHAPD